MTLWVTTLDSRVDSSTACIDLALATIIQQPVRLLAGFPLAETLSVPPLDSYLREQHLHVISHRSFFGRAMKRLPQRDIDRRIFTLIIVDFQTPPQYHSTGILADSPILYANE